MQRRECISCLKTSGTASSAHADHSNSIPGSGRAARKAQAGATRPLRHARLGNRLSQLDAHVPHLLIQLQDDLARSRKREAVWISVIVHLVLFIVALEPEVDREVHWMAHGGRRAGGQHERQEPDFSGASAGCYRRRRTDRTRTSCRTKIASRCRGIRNLIPRNCARFWRRRRRALRG